MKELDNFYLSMAEPTKSCLFALRSIVLQLDSDITPEWKYKMPFFYYKGKMFCYLWTDKITKEPYIGIMEGNKIDHPQLEKGNRARVKILRVNPNEDIDIGTISQILKEVIGLYKKRIAKI